MNIAKLHSWDLAPKDAVEVQKKLAGLVITDAKISKISAVAGADLGFLCEGKKAVAAVIVYSYPELIEIERAHVISDINYPYIPGLLSFREGPLLEKLFEKLHCEPDVILFDGQGIAHPRRLGIASHMGLVLNKPTIGCAKSRLCGRYDEPAKDFGAWSPLEDDLTGDTIGSVLRTRENVKPIFVSAGHLVSLNQAIEIVMGCVDRTRIPKPTREADKFVRKFK